MNRSRKFRGTIFTQVSRLPAPLSGGDFFYAAKPNGEKDSQYK